ncbi:ATP-grasp domain-containing protein [Xanthomonas vesicatoria]|nr:carboxylate--amine ligase [Xanthomonas vesicatoria]KTF33452.1 carboxylate--amine ligase [Xanthomonas vesicatoria]KTF36992.1 carboxylate--amine ligase [Xanthomonas vesicatoria]MCC8558433.1 siderophore biosynthesis protein PvsA [Xanthomonas vesicatoria]MCC8598038.1 siderophore biosynthesis protein PvsA [Xanthomonas vesicatoria]MCC8601557.1 siderophore biosynthesis protein PvsA [Xanthomonas vesicatoria]
MTATSAAPLVILTHVCHPAITDGFLPAAHAQGVPVWLLTDHRLDHLAYFHDHPAHAPQRVIECDVFNPLGVLDALHDAGVLPRAVFSNSDHLQTSTAVVAAGLGLPGKDWQVCYAAKNKAAMRQRLRARGLPCPWFCTLMPGAAVPTDLPWPVVAKPREGVASLDVRHCADAAQLQCYLDDLWQRHPQRTVLLEGMLHGPLFTLETLGDGDRLRAIGGFKVRLSPPPHFVECEAQWDAHVQTPVIAQALQQLRAFGVGFGVCHSEFILTADGPVLVEINYRSIGDRREFLLDGMFGGQWFSAALAPHLGQPLPQLRSTCAHALLRYYVAERDGELIAASEDRRHHDAHSDVQYRRMRTPGERIQLSHSNKDYLGVLSAVASDAQALQQAVVHAEAGLHWRIDNAQVHP